MQDDGDEDEPAEGVRKNEAGGDGDSVEEGVHGEAEQDRDAGVPVEKFVGVGFFAEVEMGRDGVLEQMDGAVAGEDERGRPDGGKLEALGEHVENGDGHHEARAESDGVAEVALGPVLADQDHAANNVGEGGKGSEEEREEHKRKTVSEELSAGNFQRRTVSNELSAKYC